MLPDGVGRLLNSWISFAHFAPFRSQSIPAPLDTGRPRNNSGLPPSRLCVLASSRSNAKTQRCQATKNRSRSVRTGKIVFGTQFISRFPVSPNAPTRRPPCSARNRGALAGFGGVGMLAAIDALLTSLTFHNHVSKPRSEHQYNAR